MKTTSRLKKGQWVIVGWADACGGPEGWISQEHAAKHSSVENCLTAGYVVAVKKNEVVIAQNWSADAGYVDTITTIPSGWITSVEVIRGE